MALAAAGEGSGTVHQQPTQIAVAGSVTTHPNVVAAALVPRSPGCVALEAGPMSEWLHTGLSQHGLETVT